jgi:hypothetical protein
VQILYNFAKWSGYDVSITDDTLFNKYIKNSVMDSWAIDAMSWAVNNGLIDGINITVTPIAFITRAQTALMIKAFCNNYIN